MPHPSVHCPCSAGVQPANANVGSTLLEQPAGCPLHRPRTGCSLFDEDMAGAPYLPFYPGDWLKHAGLRGCDPATKGIWIDMICYAWNANDEGRLRGTIKSLSRLCACSHEEMIAALDELEAEKVAEVVRDGALIVVTSHRVAEELVALAKKRAANEKYYQSKIKSGFSNDSVPDSVAIQNPVQRPLLDSDSDSSETVVEAGGQGKKTRTRSAALSVLPESAPWQIRMYAESCNRVPPAVYWPSITSQVTRKDVWQTVLDRADIEAWKPSNVDSRVEAYHKAERTLYPKVNGKDVPKKRSVDTESDAYLKAAGLIRI